MYFVGLFSLHLFSVLVGDGVSTVDGTVLIARWSEYDT